MLIQTSHLYHLINPENIEEITRGDESKVTAAIRMAIQEAKSYLSAYDLDALFGRDAPDLDNSDEEAIAPTVDDDFLKDLVINLACWKLIKLGNANYLYESLRTFYEDTIDTLTKIQKGTMTPQGWAKYVPPSDTPTPGNPIHWSSTPKRNNQL
ncbi:hypothetical protein EBZ39_03525 [bacterium]|nr:hypothetical protein [bacterium]